MKSGTGRGGGRQQKKKPKTSDILDPEEENEDETWSSSESGPADDFWPQGQLHSRCRNGWDWSVGTAEVICELSWVGQVVGLGELLSHLSNNKREMCVMIFEGRA